MMPAIMATASCCNAFGEEQTITPQRRKTANAGAQVDTSDHGQFALQIQNTRHFDSPEIWVMAVWC
jgi:hypothetical protein